MVKSQRDILIKAWMDAQGIAHHVADNLTKAERDKVQAMAERTVDRVLTEYARKRNDGELRDVTAGFKEKRKANPSLRWADFEAAYLRGVVTATAQAQKQRVRAGLPV